jgi:hypothetical protein
VCVRARFSFTVFLLSTYIEPTVFFRLSSCLPSCASCCIFISISICRFGSNHSISALVFGHSVRLRSSIALYRRIMFFCYFLFFFFYLRSVGIPSSVLKNRALEVFPVEDQKLSTFLQCSAFGTHGLCFGISRLCSWLWSH